MMLCLVFPGVRAPGRALSAVHANTPRKQNPKRAALLIEGLKVHGKDWVGFASHPNYSHAMTTISDRSTTSTWQGYVRALGPGLLMASAAIGSSHLVSSTQAGAKYEWALLVLVLLVNAAKYPFFRFAAQYPSLTGKNLVEGYAASGKTYLGVFFFLCTLSGFVGTAAVGLLSAVILQSMLAPHLPMLTLPVLSGLMMMSVLGLIIAGRYRALSLITKVLLATICVTTMITVVLAATKGSAAQPGFVGESPWTLQALPFLIALMGWMPAPVEFSAIQSLWATERDKANPTSTSESLFDFNMGFGSATVLACFFIALGALVQYGTGEELKMSGNEYVSQLVNMYGATIGDWAVPVMSFLAFAVMYGTTLTAVDGYARASCLALRKLSDSPTVQAATRNYVGWAIVMGVGGLIIMLLMNQSMGQMLRFTMTCAFLAAPVFAWLNLQLMETTGQLSKTMRYWAWAGIGFFLLFTLLFIPNLLGLIG